MAIAPPSGVATGDTVRLTAAVQEVGGGVVRGSAVTWSSLDTTIALLSSDGLLTAVRPGEVRVVATSAGARDGTATIAIAARVTGTELDFTTRALDFPGDTAQLAAHSVAGAAPYPGVYSWVSRDTTIAVVSSAGLVEARGGGTAYVVAAERGGTADSALVTVASVPLELWPTTPSFGVGFQPGRLYLNVAAPVSGPVAVHVTTSDAGIVTTADVVVPAGGGLVEIPLQVPDLTRLGRAEVTATAQWFASRSATVIVSEPQLLFYYPGPAPAAFTPHVGDTSYVDANRILASDVGTNVIGRLGSDALTVTLVSSDTMVVRPIDNIRIPAGGAFGNQARVRSVGPGTARIYFTAPGFRPDSTIPFVVSP